MMYIAGETYPDKLMTRLTMTVQELHDIFLKGIRSGEFRGRLPSSAEMKRRYGTGHNTVHLAIDRLKMQGLVYGRQGKGVFVNEQALAGVKKGVVMVYFGLESNMNIPLYLKLLTLLKAELQKSGLTLEFVSDLSAGLKKYQAAIVFGANMMREEDLMTLKYAMSGRVLLINHKLPGMVSLSSDNACGGRLAAEEIYRFGHRRIAVVTRFLDLPRNFFHERHQGFMDFAAEHPDMSVQEYHIPSEIASRSGICADIAGKILHEQPEITALFAFTDWYAFQLLQVLKRAGRTISAVGYDNSEFASLLDPPLTSIEEDVDGLSREAAHALNGLIGSGRAASRMVEPRLIQRESVFDIRHQTK